MQSILILKVIISKIDELYFNFTQILKTQLKLFEIRYYF